MHNNPLVTIITVVFNGEKYLKQTIDSVINQTYQNIEYLIIDGGSTDNTIGILKNHEEYISCWISEPDKGLYDAMNKGISMAKGELVGMVNSDDWYEPNAIQQIVYKYSQNRDKKIFHADRFDVQEDGSKQIRKFNKSTLKFLYYGMTYNHPSMFVHRDIYQNQLYNTNLKSLSDYEFVLKQFLTNRNVFLYIPISYVNYRLDGISAHMKLKDSLKEGFISRMNAGLNILQNIISIVLRGLFFSLSILKRKLK